MCEDRKVALISANCLHFICGRFVAISTRFRELTYVSAEQCRLKPKGHRSRLESEGLESRSSTSGSHGLVKRPRYPELWSDLLVT
jgi:hypothetical protein